MSGETDRPLVEAWSITHRVVGHAIYKDRRDAEHDASEIGGTVVPLVAADKLTDEPLVEALSIQMFPHLSVEAGAGAIRPVLTSLRAHLDSL